MPSTSTPDSGTHPAFTKSPGTEPIPGYRLIEPLGRGGFGEVWKCEAPGGLHKAIKFVAGDDGEGRDGAQLRQEFDAFQTIKSIRHPFLLTLERVELVEGELVMVMELADRQLSDRFKECRSEGLPGIPRAELLAYFSEAAEALDVIGSQYGLQHLDVKPANLFLTAGHVKVGDYGLVSKLDAATGSGSNRGLTPKYVAPEVLRGQVHTRSDQYSLALVYYELLTGSFPYSGKTPQQMMLQHVSSHPDVSGLPECDQSPIWTALQKKPEDRFPSCLDLVRALLEADYVEPQTPPPVHQTRPTGGGSTVVPLRQTRIEHTPGPGELTGRYPRPNSNPGTGPPRSHTGELTKNFTLKTLPRLVTPNQGMPGLITVGGRSGSAQPPPQATQMAYRPQDEDLPVAEPDALTQIRINPIRSIVPVAQLTGMEVPRAGASPDDFLSGIIEAAAAGAHVPQLPGDIGRLADGTCTCQFPSTVPAQVLSLKLGLIRDHWGLTMEQPEPTRVVLRKTAPGGLWGALSGKKAGLEVVVQLPRAARTVGEVTVAGGLFGAPDREFARSAQESIPRLIADIRRELGNVEDRRRSPRLAVAIPLTVFPFHSDGMVDPPVPGKSRDLSVGGLCFTSDAKLETKYAYIEFGGVTQTAGLAILARIIRSQSSLHPGQPQLYGVQFRTDL